MLMLTAKRSDLIIIDSLLPDISFTGDPNYCYFLITKRQYDYVKDKLPDHVIYKLPTSSKSKSLNNSN